MADARPLVDHIYRKWTDKLQMALLGDDVMQEMLGYEGNSVLQHVRTLFRELLPVYGDALHNRKSHGNQTFMTSLIHQLYRESKVPLLGNPLHNHHINYYNHNEDDFWNRPRDTTPLFMPSKLYWFAFVRENIPHKVQIVDENEEKDEEVAPTLPECSICIEKPDKGVAPGLLSICNTISRQQAATELWIEGLWLDSTKKEKSKVKMEGRGATSGSEHDNGEPKEQPVVSDDKGNRKATRRPKVTRVPVVSHNPERSPRQLSRNHMILVLGRKLEERLMPSSEAAKSLRAWHDDVRDYYNVISKEAQEGTHCENTANFPVDVSKFRGFNISRNARIIWFQACKIPERATTRLEEQLQMCTRVQRLNIGGLQLKKIPLLYSVPLKSLTYLNFASSLISDEDFLKTCKNLSRMRNLEFVDCDKLVHPSHRDQVEAVLAEMINSFLTHHQRELVLVISQFLSESFKQKWRRQCDGTKVHLHFGYEYQLKTNKDLVDRTRRRVADGKSSSRATLEEFRQVVRKLKENQK